MVQKIVRVRERSIPVLFVLGCELLLAGVMVGVVASGGSGRLAVGEDDDFVHAEDGEGAGYLARERCFEVMGLGTIK